MGQRFSVSQIGGLQTRLSTIESRLNGIAGTNANDTSCVKVGHYVFAAIVDKAGILCNCAVSCFGFSCCCTIFMGECVRGCDLLPFGLVAASAPTGDQCIQTPYTAQGCCYFCATVCSCCAFRCNFSLGGACTVYAAYGHVSLQSCRIPVTLWRRVC